MTWFGGLKVKGQGHRVNKSILHTRTAIHRHSLGGVTSHRRGFELCEYLLVRHVLLSCPRDRGDDQHGVTNYEATGAHAPP